MSFGFPQEQAKNPQKLGGIAFPAGEMASSKPRPDLDETLHNVTKL